MKELAFKAGELLAKIKTDRPLIHHYTNYVAMNDNANATLHVGALPVMAHAVEEAEEMVGLAGALVLNYGTLDRDWVEAMVLSGQRANQRGIPIVMDPVGAGATRYRTDTGLMLLRELQIGIVRGNAGEIGALTGAGGEVRGVESVGAVDDPAAMARQAATTFSTVVTMTGKRDLVTDGSRMLGVDNGHAWLQTRTATGCTATSIVAAFAAVEPDLVTAAACALAYYGLAAELAAPDAAGPATFGAAFFDRLYTLTPEQLAEGARIVDLS